MTHAAILFCLVSITMVLEKILNKKFAPMIEDIRYIDFGNIFINNFVVLLIVSIVIFISIFTYKYIEVKGQEFGKKILNKI